MKRKQRGSLGGSTLGAVHLDVDRLLVQAKVYRDLYATDEGKRVVNSISIVSFSVILHALREAMLLGITRTMIDRANDGKFCNLCLETVVSTMPASCADLTERLDELRNKHDALRVIRNKLYSHRDEGTVYDIMYRRQSAVDSVYDLHVLEAIDDVGEFWREVIDRIGISMPFTEEIDAHELIEALH